ncbi:hypothetical protein RUND412_005179 [Rhizina undulata]
MSSAAPGSPTEISNEVHRLREELLKLKQDRTHYIKSSDVVRIFDGLCEQIGRLDDVKAAKVVDAGNLSLGQVEGEIDDCFQFISLFFLTIGKNNEPPAVYAQCTIKKLLLDHLLESGNFSPKDLSTIQTTLKQIHENIAQGRSYYNPRIISIFDEKYKECEEALKPLVEFLDQISPELVPTHEKLVSLRRRIKACEAKTQFSAKDVNSYLSQIRQIDASRNSEGKFVADDGTVPEAGQEIVSTLLGRCYTMADEALRRHGAIAPSLKPLAEQLMKTNNQLAKLELTQAWSLRETDLYDYQKYVQSIDEKRVNGKFVDDEGNAPEEGQSILLYLVRRCYAHIYSLMSSSEPVSEALVPIFNQLQTVRRCLKEVEKFGITDARELYPYSMKLASIDNLRVDGKFIVGNDIPEGQGRVNSLLAECFEICQELRTREDRKSDEEAKEEI